MTDEMLGIASLALSVSEETARKNSYEIPGTDMVYFWSSARGGKNVIVNAAGEKLVAGSAIGFNNHLEAFQNGKRN